MTAVILIISVVVSSVVSFAVSVVVTRCLLRSEERRSTSTDVCKECPADPTTYDWPVENYDIP